VRLPQVPLANDHNECPRHTDLSAFQQPQETYATFGTAYDHAYDSSGALPQPYGSTDGGQGLAVPAGSELVSSSRSHDTQPHQQQLDDATPLHPLSFDEIMAAFAQASGDLPPAAAQQHRSGSSSLPPQYPSFDGEPGNLPPHSKYGQDSPSPPMFQQPNGIQQTYEQAAYPSPLYPTASPSSAGYSSSLSPHSQPSPPQVAGLPSGARPFALPLSTSPQPPPSLSPQPPFPSFHYNEKPASPNLVSPTPASQPAVYKPYAPSQRGVRSDPSHLTGGRDVAVSMSLMGVAERDETQDMSGWDDLEFGVLTKPPYVASAAFQSCADTSRHASWLCADLDLLRRRQLRADGRPRLGARAAL